ncbi:MAG: hypothetical protein U5K37_12590 [Natrialbaceae archaeon]|nr:hypothetical protein [Natrialbaceae archaeon]
MTTHSHRIRLTEVGWHLFVRSLAAARAEVDQKARDDVLVEHRPLLAVLVADLVPATPRQEFVAPAAGARRLLLVVSISILRRTELS